MKQFLVIQTAFLGDAVLVTSLVEKLHAFFPDAAIDLVVRKGNEGLFDEHPFLRKLYVWDKRQGKTRALFRLIGELRAVRYDHLFNAQRFLSTGLMLILARGNEKVGYDKNPLSFLFTRRVKHEIPEPATLRRAQDRTASTVALSPSKGDPGIHEVDRLNALIAPLTDGSRPLPRLHPAASHRAEVERLIGGSADRGIVTIAPASVWHTKQWPAEKWIALIKALPPGQRVLLTGGPGDTALCERIAREAGRGEVVAGQLSLLGTAALMQGAAMNYVNDSAPLHIASAMDAPVTAVFCSTVPAFGFGPLNANGRVMQLEEPLYCRPCGLHGYKACPEGHFKCALGIEVKAVRQQAS